LFENDVVPAPAGLPKKPVKPLPPPKRVMTGRYHASYAPKATRREIADAIDGKNNAVSRVPEKKRSGDTSARSSASRPRAIPLISRYVSDSPEHREDFPTVWGTKDRRVAVINEIIERRLAGAAEQCGDVDWNNASDLFAGAGAFSSPSHHTLAGFRATAFARCDRVRAVHAVPFDDDRRSSRPARVRVSRRFSPPARARPSAVSTPFDAFRLRLTRPPLKSTPLRPSHRASIHQIRSAGRAAATCGAGKTWTPS
jgi:hypothetical protein